MKITGTRTFHTFSMELTRLPDELVTKLSTSPYSRLFELSVNSLRLSEMESHVKGMISSEIKEIHFVK